MSEITDEQIDQQAGTEPTPLTENKIRDEMSAVFDESEAAAEKVAELKMMPVVKTDNIDQTFEKTYEWLTASATEKAELRDASKLVDQVRDNAAKFGVTLTDADAMKAAMDLEQQQARSTPTIPAELQPALQTIKQAYPDRAPHEVVSRFAEIDNYVKRAPAEAAGWIYQQTTGQSPLELARQIAAAHSPAEVQQHYALRDAETYVSAFLSAHPDVDGDQVIEALGKIQKTGDCGRDLRAAYDLIGEKPSRRGKPKQRSMESRMRQVYEGRQR
jgi:hypothetical protein